MQIHIKVLFCSGRRRQLTSAEAVVKCSLSHPYNSALLKMVDWVEVRVGWSYEIPLGSSLRPSSSFCRE